MTSLIVECPIKNVAKVDGSEKCSNACLITYQKIQDDALMKVSVIEHDSKKVRKILYNSIFYIISINFFNDKIMLSIITGLIIKAPPFQCSQINQ